MTSDVDTDLGQGADGSARKQGQTPESSNGRRYECIQIKPDQGYAWVVLVACFLINLIVDGFLYAFGAISDDLKKHYQCQEWAVTLVISLACGFYLLSAVFASTLCEKLGCGVVGIIGSIIASVAVAASVASPNIYIMWLLFGVIGGIGMGLVYLPSILMPGYCFDDKRPIATGIVTAGTGIGSIAFGPLSRYLFNLFGWKIGTLILSGILLLCAACSAVMLPCKIKRTPIEATLNSGDDEHQGDKAAGAPLLNAGDGTGEPAVPSSASMPKSDSSSSADLPKPRDEKPARTNSIISNTSKISVKGDDQSRPLKVEGELSGYELVNAAEKQPQLIVATNVTPVAAGLTNPSDTPKSAWWDSWFPVRRFNEPALRKSMIVLCLANVCSMIGYYTPYLFIVKAAELERSIPKNTAVYYLSVIGFSNTGVRFLSGWITKLPYMSPLLVNNIGLTVAGIATLLVPLCQTNGLLIAYCLVWGGFIAFHVSQSPVIIYDIVGLDKFSSALGLTLTCRGITSLAAPPLMGAIQDFTASFDVPFIIGGISFLISALLHFYLMWIERKKKSRARTGTNGDAVQTKHAALDV